MKRNPSSKQPRRTPLKAYTLSETIFHEVRNRLQRGEIGADDRILDYEIAQEYNCTRMPVRQALLRLASEGYLLFLGRVVGDAVEIVADVTEPAPLARAIRRAA